MNINRILNILQKICYFLYKNKSPPHRRTLNIYQLRLNKFFNNNALHSVFWCFFIPNRPNFILYFNTFYTFLIFKYQKSITHTDYSSYCCQEQQTGMLSRIELFLVTVKQTSGLNVRHQSNRITTKLIETLRH